MSAAPGPHGPGELFLGEIREQPEALLRLVEQEAEFEAVTKAMRERRPAVVRLVGHGSSDAAASYGVYAFGLLPGWTAMRDSISLTVYYDAKLDLSDSVVIALSQSGETPDVVEYLHVAASFVLREMSVDVVPPGRVPVGAPSVRTGGVVSALAVTTSGTPFALVEK